MPQPRRRRRRKSEDTYHLIVTKKQAQVIQQACEVVMRLGLGQLDYITDHIYHLPRLKTPKQPHDEKQMQEWYAATRRVRDLLDAVTFAASGWQHGASYGIGSPELPPSVGIATDIRDVIRHRLAHDQLAPGEKRGWTVDFNEPMKWGSEPLIDIRRPKKRKKSEEAKPS